MKNIDTKDEKMLYEFLSYIGEHYGYRIHIGDCLNNSRYGHYLTEEFLRKYEK